MKIVVVGGGTSGWIVTNYLSGTHHCINISTKEIPTIGVGEGTTGKFPDMLGVDKTELMIELDALPKLGIKFNGWSKTSDHFWSPIDGSATANYYIDYSTFSQYFTGALPTSCSKYSVLMEDGLTNYSYEKDFLVGNWDHHALHIDAYKTAEYFKKISLDSGAVHVEAQVVKVNREKNAITSLELDNGSIITGDVFIDCSGFSRVLNSHLDWIDYSEYLPVNSAVVYSAPETEKKPYTVAQAMKYGWTWEIPTRNKTGRGYVYCDKYASEDDILDELGDVEKIKSIKFTSGRINQFKDSNCVSIGLSSGFLEPLQATSIHCALIQLELFFYSFPTKQSLLCEDSTSRYNNLIAILYDDMRDFVSLHYSGGKTDSDFWKDITCTDRVHEILNICKARLTRSFDFPHVPGTVKQESWNPILAGLGHFDKSLVMDVFTSDGATMKWWMSKTDEFIREVADKSQNFLTPDQLNAIISSVSGRL
ncbi:tryptophan halogenase [Cyanophage S-RIM44]|uniref:Tryptophan halogenase n=1 Tax=Cyanophage S-RIM44 TaxID=1278485 RepID=A0A1D7SDE5_9CAUD|nr:tryptophan halogenase [Cyanophage S-RIM44]AOO11686.1 tryptophan halogenase [Cyanophage S-RIM44]AOO12152.1 tryptophan halogenase [Cyanophage S-RIM44]AOO12387.1 tryptophan halogenase [Cyanophage S-RIM44]AOO12852.1 tryptophan halogenase [Cyanophage S-RIM44]